MSLINDSSCIYSLLRMVLEPLYNYNPFFTLYSNPLLNPPQPQVSSKPYYNYIHQISLLLDTIPRSKIRILIGDEVGLGKTVEAIRIVKHLVSTGLARRVLIIAPKTLIKQWLYHDIRDLLYSPGRVKRVTRRSIDEILDIIRRDVDSTIVYLAPIDLVKRGTSDKHSKGRFKPYYDFISSIDWDVVVVDEAHQLGFTGSKSSLRTERLAPICKRAKHLILLSATPSRGTHEDMLGRISLLLPEFEEKIKAIGREPYLRRDLYHVLSDYIIYRRCKEHVNSFEGREIFTKLSSFIALIKLGDRARLYDDLGRTVSILLRSIDATAPGLVKVIILKRALSSPYAFLKTIKNVLDGRIIDAKGKCYLSSRYLEANIDKVVEDVLRIAIDRIPSNLRNDISRLLREFEELQREGDPGFKALAHLLYNVVIDPKSIPRDLNGDYIVFSEYRDTVDYIYGKLIEFFTTRGFIPDAYRKRVVIDNTVRKYYEKKYYEPRSRKYAKLLEDSLEILMNEEKRKGVFIAKLSSLNQEIIHLIPELIESVKEVVGDNTVKVLISTDIASEGLNLYHFNIVVNYDIPWSPVKREQRIGRVYRLRQTRDCTVLDFIRDTVVEYEFYTKLVLKLLNLVEQRISSRPLEGVVELYITKKQGTGEEYLQVSEKDIGIALCMVYENYYVNGKVVSDVLNRVREELAVKIRKYRDLVEDLTQSYSVIESIKNYVAELTGCSNHEQFINTICRFYRALTGRSCNEISKVLLDLYEEIFKNKNGLPDQNIVILVKEPGVEKGYLNVVDLVVDGIIRYSTPVLFLYRNGRLEVKHGLELLNWFAESLGKRSLSIVKLSVEGIGGDEEEFHGLIDSFTNKFKLLFFERIGVKNRRLTGITGPYHDGFRSVELIPKPVLIRIIGMQSIDEYEKFLVNIPVEVRSEMERLSIEYVKELFENRGCRVLEVNVGVYKPYDLLVECVEEKGLMKYMVEVKSHLKRILVAELTPAETKLAEDNPGSYIVCNVAGMENRDRSSWIVLCDLYERIRKELITKTKEERIARLYFNRNF